MTQANIPNNFCFYLGLFYCSLHLEVIKLLGAKKLKIKIFNIIYVIVDSDKLNVI